MIRVTSVKPLEHHRLELSFNTGEMRVFDVTPYLDKGIFTELRDPEYFRRVRVKFGTVTWPNEQDFGPESLYAESRAPSTTPAPASRGKGREGD